ncbi:MAG: AzlC family ABC transporter permease [Rhizobiales bacterium]|nr:AzlC family ABC transporter permease [Hyphomicrobiales bacterium]
MDEFRRGAIDSLPLGLTAAMFAVIFGAASIAKGLSFFEIMTFTSFVFAASVQFATLSIWADTMPFATVIISGFLIASRNIFAGMVLGHTFKNRGFLQKYLSIFLFTDISYVLGVKNQNTANPFIYMAGVGIMVYSLWVFGTLIGLLVAEYLTAAILESLAYSGAMYMGLLVLMLVKPIGGVKLPLILAGLTTLILVLLDASQLMIMLGSVSVGGICNYWLEPQKNKKVETENG